MKYIFLIVSVFSIWPQAYGFGAETSDFLIAPGIFYSSGVTSRNSKHERAEMRAELKLAYQIYPNLYFGPTYVMGQETTKTSGYSNASLNNISNGRRQSYGGSLGYVTSSYHFYLTYFAESVWKLDTETSTSVDEYIYKGDGFQLDVAYKIPIWDVFFFGPQLSYKSLTYSTLSSNAGDFESISPKMEEKGIEPSIVLYWFF